MADVISRRSGPQISGVITDETEGLIDPSRKSPLDKDRAKQYWTAETWVDAGRQPWGPWGHEKKKTSQLESKYYG